ncbi:hypothetical protein KXT59_23845, partial [Salmonella enterica subsp. enterica serovar Weltevreden]|nr:hypothetical protein [Salmonella enterica subsp. enterica serovar Weltevreden]
IHGTSHGQDQLVGRHHTAFWITHLPPPLMPGHFDTQRLVIRQGQHAAPGGQAERQQQNDAGRGQYQAATDEPAQVDAPCLCGAGFPGLSPH